MELKKTLHTLLDKLPSSNYSDGKHSKCIFFRLACMLDPLD